MRIKYCCQVPIKKTKNNIESSTRIVSLRNATICNVIRNNTSAGIQDYKGVTRTCGTRSK